MSTRTHRDIDVVVDIVEDDSDPSIVTVILKKNAFEKAKSKCSRLYYILMCKIPTYGAEVITFICNDSNIPHAALGHRVSLCPLKQWRITEENKRVPSRISFQGPGYVLTGMCKEMHFSSPSIKLCYLEDRTKLLILDCHLVKGDANVHGLFNPLCNIFLTKVDDSHLALQMTNLGHYSTSELAEQITALYNDDALSFPLSIPKVKGVRYTDDIINRVPRSSLTLPYGMLERTVCSEGGAERGRGSGRSRGRGRGRGMGRGRVRGRGRGVIQEGEMTLQGAVEEVYEEEALNTMPAGDVIEGPEEYDRDVTPPLEELISVSGLRPSHVQTSSNPQSQLQSDVKLNLEGTELDMNEMARQEAMEMYRREMMGQFSTREAVASKGKEPASTSRRTRSKKALSLKRKRGGVS